MDRYEYKAVPAPVQGKREKGARSQEAAYANSMTQILNQMSADGWEYLRCDSLPSTDRTGIMRRKIENENNLLIFRRPADDAFIEAHKQVSPKKSSLKFNAPKINLGAIKKKKPAPKAEPVIETSVEDTQPAETSKAKA